jgi:hypothetical protein
MASGTFYPAVSGDDGYFFTINFMNSGDRLFIGDSTGNNINIFIRFPNVTIPAGAAISEAYIRFTSFNTQSSITLNENCYFNNVDNAVAPTNASEAGALVLTSAIAWNNLGAWTDDVQYDTPELKTILQTVISRGGWSSGQAIQGVLKDNGSDTNATRDASSIDYVSGAEKAELHVTWELMVIDADVTVPALTAQGYTGIYSVILSPMVEAQGFTGITAELTVPVPVAHATLSDDMEHITASVVAPMATASLTQAEQIWGAVTAPMMVASLTERETVLCSVTVPMSVVKMTSGLHLNADIEAPMMTVEGLFSAQCKVTVPAMTVEMEGTVGKVGSFDITVPMLTVSIEGKTEHLGDISVSVPMLQVLAKLTGGKIITGAVVAPMIAASLSSYEEITGDIAVTVPALEAYMIGTAERVVCPILRYDDKPDILGSITALNPMSEVSIT